MINKILVIDDDSIFCNAIKYHLSQKMCEVEICTSYNEFKKRININEFHLILLDMRLKDAEGLDILNHILKTSPNKKVIIVSSYLNDENILKAREIGAYKCINKNSSLFERLDIIIEKI